MTDFPDLKFKTLISFPATVSSGTGVTVRKQNGQFYFDIDYSDFAPPITNLPDRANQDALIWNNITGVYSLVPVDVAFPPVVPSDANPSMDGVAAPGVAVTYSRGDHVHPSDTSRQPLDAALTALSNLSATAGLLVQTGIDTFDKQSILAGALIGVTNGNGVAGSPTVSVTDPEILALGGLVSAADRLPYFTGSGTASLATFTAYARTLVDDPDAATARTTLGLTSAATATPAALTKTDDANVTLTLGGTPGTALLQATSLTLGWNGTLSTARSGLGLNASGNTGVPVFSAGAASFDAQMFSNIPQNAQAAAYTLVASDAQKHILHPATDNNARTYTIPANASVPYPIGTCITFVNKINTLTIAINSDTLTLSPAGTTGSRTLAANGVATAMKIAATEWIISGPGLA